MKMLSMVKFTNITDYCSGNYACSVCESLDVKMAIDFC